MGKMKLWLASGALCAFAGVSLLLRSAYEREQLSVERTTIASGKIKKDRTIVFLSDLHSHEFGSNNEKLIQAVGEAEPDLILVGGDMMITKKTADLGVSLKLFSRLVELAPVYYGNGNHEQRLKQERQRFGTLYERYVKQVAKMGVTVLSNETQRFGEDIAVTGIDLYEKHYRKFMPLPLLPEEIRRLAGKAEKERYQILLCHSPLFFDSCREWGADLTFCGHFHGGTIRLPYLGGVMTPQFQLFLPCCAGEFEKDERRMIVSRGLGTHSINVRLNNKPQVVVVNLRRARGAGGMGGSYGNFI